MVFDKSKFIDQYKSETREHIQNLNKALLSFEKSPQARELMDTLMKESHTIKGSSVMMGFKRIADIAHKMEDVFQKALDGKISFDKNRIDVIFKCIDAIDNLLEDKVTWLDKGVSSPFVENLCKEVDEVFSQKISAVNKEQLLQEKKEAPSQPAAIHTLEEGSIRVDIDKLDKLMNISGELLISKIRLNDLIKDLPANETVKELKSVFEGVDFLTSQMQQQVMDVRMVPISHLFNIFPRAMRDLAQEKGKDIEFRIKGEATQLDKAIIDQMKDPLMHILRNAVDHGIESSGERKAANKERVGNVILNAYQVGSQVVIEVFDDGAGIDVAKVKQKAVDKGIISKDKIDLMVDQQIFQFLFMPGFSTKDAASLTSGRGFGLDVVRESVAKLKGIIEIESKPGVGAKFIIKLPLTLAITECLIIGSGTETFALPIDTVVETIRIEPKDISTVESKEAIIIRGHIMPVIRLNDLFNLSQKGIFEKKYLSLVIVQAVERRVGLLVDQIIGRQEIVSKPIGEPLKKIKNIAGATILGDGSVILILDVPSIIESAEGIIIRRPRFEAGPEAPAQKKKKKTILLAEDVLSTAMLEKNILESVGYSVVIARDGKEAIEKAGQEKFDLVITDILMPRMDGFELTGALKKNKLYKDIPIIIVTTRESEADKRRGLEAGADAYILKSEFTSEGLLETIERLIG